MKGGRDYQISEAICKPRRSSDTGDDVWAEHIVFEPC